MTVRIMFQPRNIGGVLYDDLLVIEQVLDACNAKVDLVVLDGCSALVKLRGFERMQVWA